MAISPRMLAVLQKVDAARAAHFDGLRKSARRNDQLREKKRTQWMKAKKKPPQRAM